MAEKLTLPLLGVGTYKLKDPQVVKDILSAALDSGYSLIDTAAVYKNEHTIGEVHNPRIIWLDEGIVLHLPAPSLAALFAQAPKDHGYDNTLQACQRSLEALKRPHLDAYLIHWPGVAGRPREDSGNVATRRETWLAMEELYRLGKAKAIGVSNYTTRHIEELLGYASIVPHLVQNECHPLLAQKEVRSLCAKHGIAFQAYSSLGAGKLLCNDAVTDLALKYGVTASVVLLRWAIQQEIGVIPKASTIQHITENVSAMNFELTTQDMDLLNSLDKDFHFCWDPTHVT